MLDTPSQRYWLPTSLTRASAVIWSQVSLGMLCFIWNKTRASYANAAGDVVSFPCRRPSVQITPRFNSLFLAAIATLPLTAFSLVSGALGIGGPTTSSHPMFYLHHLRSYGVYFNRIQRPVGWLLPTPTPTLISD